MLEDAGTWTDFATRIYDRIIKLFDKVNWESYLYGVCEWQGAQRKGSEQCMQLTEGQDCINGTRVWRWKNLFVVWLVIGLVCECVFLDISN